MDKAGASESVSRHSFYRGLRDHHLPGGGAFPERGCGQDPSRGKRGRLRYRSKPQYCREQYGKAELPGLGTAFKSEITARSWPDGPVQLPRLSGAPPEMPPVEAYFIDSGARPPGGTGEVGPATVIPALASALFAATGSGRGRCP